MFQLKIGKFLLFLCFAMKFESSVEFQCETDGIFEDDQDCRRYYECSWVGTQFERVEHIKCADELFYNPQHYRCDDITVFRLQFARRNLTSDDLLGFIRFQHCLAENNMLDEAAIQMLDSSTEHLIVNGETDRKFGSLMYDETQKTVESTVSISASTTISTPTSSTKTTTTVPVETTQIVQERKLPVKSMDFADMIGGEKIFLSNPSDNKAVENKFEENATDGATSKYHRSYIIELLMHMTNVSTTITPPPPPATTTNEKTVEIERSELFGNLKSLLSFKSRKTLSVTDDEDLHLPVKHFNKTERKPLKFVSKLKKVNLSSISRVNDELELEQNFIKKIQFNPKNEDNSYLKTANRIKPIDLGFDGKQLFEMDKIQAAPSMDPLITCKDNDFGLECSCSARLTPQKCKQLVNAFLTSCRIVGCKNNGRCINMAFKYPIPYMCSCPSAYSGNYCEKPRFDELKCKDVCKNSGDCEVVNDMPKCNCKHTNFTGEFCDVPLSSQKPLQKKLRLGSNAFSVLNCTYDCGLSQNRGRCVLSLNGHPKCVCDQGWKGVDCSEADYCLYNDCLNNSTCSNQPSDKTYVCVCKRGWTGPRCDIKSQQTEEAPQAYNSPSKNDPCSSVRCSNDGTCVTSYSHEQSKFSFICLCKPGYRGLLCEIEENPCETNPCNSTDYVCVSLGFQNFKCLCVNFETNCSNTDNTIENTTQVIETTEESEEEIIKTTTVPVYQNDINPCLNDLDLCLKYPQGNETYVCLRNSNSTFDCILRQSQACSQSPCQNNGTCIDSHSNSWICSCDSEYTGVFCETKLCTNSIKLLENHTMCTNDSNKFQNGSLSNGDINHILDFHNSIRRIVEPTASNMQKMYWDVELQYFAQKSAQKCSQEPIDVQKRQLPKYGVVLGENRAFDVLNNWTEVLQMWKNEGLDNAQGLNNCTQMLYSGASRIGCGFAQCSNGNSFVCYYAEGKVYDQTELYQTGATCSMCKGNCNSGLCDCGGVRCLNGGLLDMNTCTCICPYSLYSGKYCEKVNCPREDSSICSQTSFEDKCSLYPVIRASCPYMCQICTATTKSTNVF